MREILDRLQGHNHHNGRTVRVCNYSSRPDQSILGIALRHHERHVLVHPERAGVVYHHSTVLRNGIGKFLRSAGSRRYKGIVNALEVIIVLEQPDLILLAPELILCSGTPLRTEEKQFVYGEIPLRKHAEKLLSNGAACADNRYFHIL